MHRLIAAAVLIFWAIMFAGLAHVSLNGILSGNKVGASQLQLLLSTVGEFQVLPVLFMAVAALFGWAVLALTVSDEKSFREVEAYSFATAIFLMGACAVIAFAKATVVVTMPAVLTAALAACVAALQHLKIADEPEPAIYQGRAIARRMALGAAHNSLLSRVSGRPLPGHNLTRHNVTLFPAKPSNRGDV